MTAGYSYLMISNEPEVARALSVRVFPIIHVQTVDIVNRKLA